MRALSAPLAAILLLLLSWAAGTRAQETNPPSTIHVGGAVAKPTDWTADKIKQTFGDQLKPVDYAVKGEKHASTCVPLLAVVQAAEPVTDPKHKSFAMRLVVVVRATDGYTASFALGELLPDIGNHPVWLAIDQDGHPLSGRQAPMKLIVPGDGKPSRAVWGIERIDVVDPTTVSAAKGN